MTLNFTEISQLKQYLKEKVPECVVHAHDVCGGQYFTLEGSSSARQQAIDRAGEYFSQKGMKIFADDDCGGFRL